jgi:hypothetical protein
MVESVINFWAAHFVFGFGFLLFIVAAILAVARNLSVGTVLRVICAVGAACMLSEVPGLLNVQLGGWLTAAGTVAVFALVLLLWR